MAFEFATNPVWNVGGWEYSKVAIDIDMQQKSRGDLLTELMAARKEIQYIGPWPRVMTVFHDGQWHTVHFHEDGSCQIV